MSAVRARNELVGVGGALAGAWSRRYRPLRLRDGLTAVLARGEAEVRQQASLIDEFVAGCAGAGAWAGTTGWVRDSVALQEIPIVAFVFRGEMLLAIALGMERKIRGRASWLGSCGNLTGQRGIFVALDEGGLGREEILLAAGDALMHTGLAALMLSCKGSGSALAAKAASGKGVWSVVAARTERAVYDTFDLGRTMEESLGKLGAHTRRNLRYYRRRAERELHCEFLAEMDGALMRAAVVELQFATDDRIVPGVAKNRIAEVMRRSESFCMGLRSADGEWLSWLTGWRVGRETFVDWQCNRGSMPRYSMSTVMRSYLIEHETQRGQTQLRFLGGTPHTMHYGFREEMCEDWLFVRRGPWAWMLRSAGPVLRMLREWKKRKKGTAAGLGGKRRELRGATAIHLIKRMAGVLMSAGAANKE